MPQQSTDAGVGSTCPVRGGGTDISARAPDGLAPEAERGSLEVPGGLVAG